MTEADFLHVDAEHAEYIGTLEGYYGSEDRPFSVRPFNADVVNTVKKQHIQARLFSAETNEEAMEEAEAEMLEDPCLDDTTPEEAIYMYKQKLKQKIGKKDNRSGGEVSE